MKYFLSTFFCIVLLQISYAFPDALCRPGTYSDLNPTTQITTCVDCPAGRFQSQEGASTCEPCALGEYQDEVGQASCKVCPPGTTTSFEGSSSIDSCKKADSVPAMNRWGLLLLIGSVLGVATLLLKRQGTFGK